ncbi:Cytochrome c family protein [Candidatus Burkholderia humilis]|nr:Cytochrome c family protein [Candidatus Burkholderia humilis]
MKIKHALASASLLMATMTSMAAHLVIDTGTKQTLSTEQLLARADATIIHVPDDVTYHRTMTYCAVPLRALLGIAHLPSDQEIQITGTDGSITHLPASLLFNDVKPHATASLAIESSDVPWPRAPGNGDTGPFYVAWTDAVASHVKSEQWPYKVDAIRTAPTLAVKWPQIAVGNHVPADSPIRNGQTIFATQCMACHMMNGAGDASLGPDLNLPHNPTEYFQPWALRQFIRDPKSIRAWSGMKMHGFDRAAMTDADLDAVIAYLRYMAGHRK